MSATRAPTLGKLPGRMTLAVISPKKPSTRLSQEEEVGMKMEVKTGMTLKPGGDFGVLGGRIVVANNVKLQLGGDFLVDLAQEGEPLLMAMARGGCGQTPCRKGSPGRQRGSPFRAGSSHGSGCECVPGPKAIRAGSVREPDTGSFHRCRAPRPARAGRDRGPRRPRIFPQTEGLWRA